MYQNDEDQNGNPCTYPSCDTDANKTNSDYDFSCAELVLQVYLVPDKVTTMFMFDTVKAVWEVQIKNVVLPSFL